MMRTKMRAALSLLTSRLLGSRIPLFVGWQLTARCNLRCSYCNIWENPGELSTDEILKGIDQLRDLGTAIIAFTGGEPLLRDDIPEILERTYRRGILSRLHTNGYYLPKIVKHLHKLHAVVLSLDGPREVHDAIRGKGSYDRVVEAAELAKGVGVKVLLTAVLSSGNVDSVDALVKEAEMLGARMTFQPVIQKNEEWMSVDHLRPGEQDYRQAFKRIMWHKERGAPVGNSMASLRAFLGKKMDGASALGRVYINISYDGRVYASSSQVGDAAPNLRDTPLEDIIPHLKLPAEQPHCTLAAEMNSLYNLDPRSVLNAAFHL